MKRKQQNNDNLMFGFLFQEMESDVLFGSGNHAWFLDRTSQAFLYITDIKCLSLSCPSWVMSSCPEDWENLNNETQNEE